MCLSQCLSNSEWKLEHITDSLNEIANNSDENPSTRNEINALKEKLSSLETILMIILWSTILERFNKVKVKCSMKPLSWKDYNLLWVPLCFFLRKCEKASLIYKMWQKTNIIWTTQQKRKKSTKFGEFCEPSKEMLFTVSENFHVNNFNVILDPYIQSSRDVMKNIDSFITGLIFWHF